MKTILASACVILASCFAFGEQSYWAAVNVGEYSTKDSSPSTANASGYTAYYCTVAAAEAMFGGASTVKGIEDYLSANFAAGKAAMGSAAGSVAIDASRYYADGQYTFITRFGTAVADGNYFAVAFYKDEAFRVFGSDNAVLDSGNLTFDDKTSGMVGGWTVASVPEPTSGLLLALGLAGLALRRKRG